ncbi:MAG: pyridoxamine 5'-phosphate oxidase family protein [Candidatus Thorarchaeota archaeon]|jgi:general stress protein 26
MSADEHKKIAIQLMETAKAVFVTTIDKTGYPQTRAMFNLRNKEQWPKLIPLFGDHNEDFMALFTTNTSSTKIADIRRNSAVSVYYCNPDEWRGLMLGGNIEIVDDSELKKSLWHDGWEKYYPGGYDDPDHTVLRIFPTVGRGWNLSTTYRFDLD